jgi:endonuclease/exonuclease/phosphatase (EEP) superfamily protein YafD
MTTAGPTTAAPAVFPPRPGVAFVVRFLALFTWVITTGIAALLLYSRLLPQRMTSYNQVYKWLVAAAFFGQVLTFQIGLGLAGVTLLAAVLRRWRLVMFAGLMSLLCIVPTTGPLLSHSPVPVTGHTWRLMDMNVKYHWGNSPSIIRQVRQFKPDVITVEDPTTAWDDEAAAALDGEYRHRILNACWGEGLEVYSKFPFTGGPPKLKFDKIHRQLRVELLIDDKPVVLYVLHPYSPRTPNRIMRNRIATVGLADDIAADVYPVVAAGDFNFTAETPNEKLLKSVGLSDAWEQAGWGRGSTWPNAPQWIGRLPGVRIDHVFLSKDLTCTGFDRGTYDGSDHLPIVVDIGRVR